MSSPTTLTPTSYIVLGFLAFAREATPYELKAGHAGSVGNFWSVPHSQLYAEPDRLAEGGYVTVRREEGGRRRKHYALTDRGREALDAWLADPTTPPVELRDPALLKLFFGADPAAIAPAQVELHRRRLAEYTEIRENLRRDGGPSAAGAILTLDAGIAHAEVSIAYWARLARSSPAGSARGRAGDR